MLYHQVRHFSYHCVWKIIEHCTKKMEERPGQTPAQKLAQKQKKSDDTNRVDAVSLATTLQSVTSRASPW